MVASPPILGPHHALWLSAAAAAIVCIATLVSSATAFAIASFAIAYSFAIFFYIFLMST